MLVRIYETLWALYATTALALVITGNLTMFTGVLMGFTAATLIFMGIIAVLPVTIAHPRLPEPAKAPVEAPATRIEAQPEAFGVLKSA